MSNHMEDSSKQLAHYIDLYKFHWELSLKLTIFTLGVSGALAAYVLKNQAIPLMEFVLLLPILLSGFMSWLAHRSANGITLIRNEAIRLAQELNWKSQPEFRSLISFLFTAKILCVASTLGLLILFGMLMCQYS